MIINEFREKSLDNYDVQRTIFYLRVLNDPADRTGFLDDLFNTFQPNGIIKKKKVTKDPVQ